ncbi:hypothetical protein ACLKA6_011578 [Drosophila palustris]
MLGSLNAVSTEDVDEDECEDECEYSYLQVITIDDPSRSPFINAFNVSLRWQVADQVNVPQMQLTRKQLRAADVAILQVMATTKATTTTTATAIPETTTTLKGKWRAYEIEDVDAEQGG